MSILGQKKIVEELTKDICFKNIFIKLTEEINRFGGSMEVNERLLGNFKSIIVFENNKKPTIELYIGARIVEKEVENEFI